MDPDLHHVDVDLDLHHGDVDLDLHHVDVDPNLLNRYVDENLELLVFITHLLFTIATLLLYTHNVVYRI